MDGKMTLRIIEYFESAHKLNDYVGKCAQIHGHKWKIEIYIKVDTIQPNGISIDFGDIKTYLKEFLPDHTFLNESLNIRYPTAENLVVYFYDAIKKQYPNLLKVVLWESDQNGIEYSHL